MHMPWDVPYALDAIGERWRNAGFSAGLPPKQRFCATYPNVSRCRHGAHCAFAHSREEVTAPLLTPEEEATLPEALTVAFFTEKFKTMWCPIGAQHDWQNCASTENKKYRPEVLAKCVCTTGTECNRIIANAGVAAVASTMFVRIALGTLLERFGPVNVQAGLLTFGALWVALSALIQEVWQYTVIRFFIGFVGATFVTNQFWCSLMFSQSIVGTANATAAGWGNLGGGVTQIFMISVLFDPMVNSGLTADTAWRVSMTIPAILFLLCAAALKLLCWDMPTAKHIDVATIGKTRQPSLWDYVEDEAIVEQLAPHLPRGACVVSCTSGVPTVTKRLANSLHERFGLHFLDCPVSGGPLGAAAGSLTCMLGSDSPEAAEKALPVLQTFAQKVVRCGPSGAGGLLMNDVSNRLAREAQDTECHLENFTFLTSAAILLLDGGLKICDSEHQGLLVLLSTHCAGLCFLNGISRRKPPVPPVWEPLLEKAAPTASCLPVPLRGEARGSATSGDGFEFPRCLRCFATIAALFSEPAPRGQCPRCPFAHGAKDRNDPEDGRRKGVSGLVVRVSRFGVE
eukprot:g29739.t1